MRPVLTCGYTGPLFSPVFADFPQSARRLPVIVSHCARAAARALMRSPTGGDRMRSRRGRVAVAVTVALALAGAGRATAGIMEYGSENVLNSGISYPSDPKAGATLQGLA